MPVYLITLHAYRSWNADNPRGFVRRDGQGIHRPNQAWGRARDDRAKQPPVRFTKEQQAVMLDTALDVAERRDWSLHAASATPTHLHVLVSWPADHVAAKKASDTFKSIVGMMLSKHAGLTGRRWFSRGESIKRVRDREHFDYLCETYLPKHMHEDGTVRVYRYGKG